MPRTLRPRSGSMQFWPRKGAKRDYARIRSWPSYKEPVMLGFAGYKVGMTHIMIKDNRPKALTKGEDIFCPVTIVECPPLRTVSIRFYKKTNSGLKVISDVITTDVDKELYRKVSAAKKASKKAEDVKDYDDIRLVVYTSPANTGIGKKRPEIFEIGLGGTKEQKLKYAQEKLGKEISVKDVLKEGQQLDAHSVTQGKGYQGPVRRFGVSLRRHKSEKTKRGPGSLGAWCAQGHIMYRVAHAGRTGYNLRTEYNKWLIKIGDKPEEINQKGGFLRYGIVKNPYILVKGSLGGPANRLITLSYAMRENKGIPKDAPQITYISTESKQ